MVRSVHSVFVWLLSSNEMTFELYRVAQKSGTIFVRLNFAKY